MPRPIDAFLIGAQKAATSSLHFGLMASPEIGTLKSELRCFEPPFYGGPEYDETLATYRSRFADKKIWMLKRPNLLANPGAAERIHAYNPDAKIIAVLRNPVDRAVSAVIHLVKSGLVRESDLDATLRRLFESNGDASAFTPPERSVREFGLYGKWLKTWLDSFPREQVLVHIQTRPFDLQEVLDKTCAFLGVTPVALSTMSSTQSKAGTKSRQRLQFLATASRLTSYTEENGTFTSYRRPVFLFHGLMRVALGVDRFLLSRLYQAENLVVSPETLQLIGQFYLPDIEELESLIGCDLSQWK